ncbi:MAG TPA: YCF48-related protein, partial [Bacillales bacterium]|nr:YCF48-related protein [Bacillales bacterium]
FKLIKSLDGGRHWETAGGVPNDAFLHFVSKDEAFSANAETFNGGKTWRNLPIPKNTVGNAYFHDQNNGWVVTKGTNTFHVERTTDAGKTWHIVMTRKTAAPLTGVIIRSAGSDDAWVECIGDSGMSQTSYSLFHTTDGGKNWKTVIANSTAGGGPAPGFSMNDYDGPHNAGSAPGPLYVVNSKVAFMAGKCPACNEPNSIGWTKDGGKTWVNGKAKFKGYGPELLAIANAKQGWWITTNNHDQKTSTMYTTSDGGEHWTKVHVFQ